MSSLMSTGLRAISTSGSADLHPQTTALVGGGYVVTWAEQPSPFVAEVRFRIMDNDGNLTGPVGSLVFNNNGSIAPEIVALDDGGFFIAGNRTNGSTPIEWGRFDAEGTLLSSGDLPGHVAENSTAISMVQDIDGIIRLAYVMLGGGIEIIGISPNGNGTVTELTFTSVTFDDVAEPALTVDQDGAIVIAFTDFDELFYARYSSDGLAPGDPGYAAELVETVSPVPITINGTRFSTAENLGTSVTLLSNGGILATYTSSSNTFPGTQDEIWAQIYDPFGADVGDQFRLNLITAGDQSHHAVQALSSGRFVVVYMSQDSAYAQIFSDFGQPLNGPIRLTASDGTQDFAFQSIDIDELTDGRLAFTFGAEGIDGADAGNASIHTMIIDLQNAQGFGLFVGTDGDDTVTGSSADDELAGDDGNDRLIGDVGNDRLMGGTGNDTLFGGSGIDTLHGDAGADELIGGSFIDWASYEGSSVGVLVTVGGSGAGGHAQGDILRGIENVIGSQGNDQLRGDTNANVLDGQAGNDILTGNGGDDTMFGAGGNDAFVGGQGADFMDGGTGIDRVSYATETVGMLVTLGGSGVGGQAQGDAYRFIENITAGSGNDELRGDAGANLFFGQAGNDTLFGNGGNDDLRGGDDNDVLVGGAGADILRGNAGSDRASYSTSSTGITIDLSNVRAATGGDALGDIFESIERVTGSTGNDDIRGDTGANVLDGFMGNDTLNGGTGNDALIGGAGVDTFQFFNSFGVDRIIDFNNGVEMVDMTGNVAASALTLNVNLGATGNVFADFGTADAIEFVGITNVALITADDFIF